MSDKYYDLLVIGGGPAGAATAYWAASAGLKTAIVEKKVFHGKKPVVMDLHHEQFINYRKCN